jgi:hypothetical protein
MENMSTEPIKRTTPLANGKSGTLRFMILLAVVFLQQFSFGSSYYSGGLLGSPSHQTIASKVQQLPAQSDSPRLGPDIEIEIAEEDDDLHDQDQFNGGPARTLVVEEIHYTSYLKSRFSRLVRSADHQAELPFFILYHCWKSDLS